MFHFVPFTVIGDPDIDRSLEIVRHYVDGGATMLELGFPFSDPVADGPVIQAADQRALTSGMNTDKAFDFIQHVRTFTDIPIGLLLYYNLVFAYGLEAFYKRASEVGVTSILIADLPVDSPHGRKALEMANRYGIQPIFMVSELTPPARLDRILDVAEGYLYLVSTPGVTGERQTLSERLHATIASIKDRMRACGRELPILVGFGVRERSQVKRLREAGADGVIVGSHLVRLIEQKDHEAIPNALAELVG